MQRHAIAVAVALALATAFAGCIEMDGLFPYAADDTAEPTEPTDPQEPTDGNETSPPSEPSPTEPPPEPAENRAPAALLDVSNETGQAPFNVSITVDGSDPDGDDLSWTLDLGDGNDTSGDELPATVVHNYTTAGNFTLTLTVSDGDLTATATVSITVDAGGPEVVIEDPVEFTGTLILFSPAPTEYCVQAGIGTISQVGNSPTNVNARLLTLQTYVQDAGWVYGMDANPDAFSLRWFDGPPGHTWFVPDHGAPAPVPQPKEPLRYDATAAPGVVPDGATHVELCLTAGPPEALVDYTFTLYHPLHPDAPVI